MDRERAVFDHDVGPEPGAERPVRHQPATGLDQQYQDLPGLARDGHAPAVPRQPTLSGIENKGTKRVSRH